MYHSFCLRAFTAGILKEKVDEMPWEDCSILLHEMKIEEEDNLVRMLEQEEKSQSH